MRGKVQYANPHKKSEITYFTDKLPLIYPNLISFTIFPREKSRYFSDFILDCWIVHASLRLGSCVISRRLHAAPFVSHWSAQPVWKDCSSLRCRIWDRLQPFPGAAATVRSVRRGASFVRWLLVSWQRIMSPIATRSCVCPASVSRVSHRSTCWCTRHHDFFTGRSLSISIHKLPLNHAHCCLIYMICYIFTRGI